MLCPLIKIRLPLVRARPIFYMTKDNPDIGLDIVELSLYTFRIVLMDDFYKRKIDMLA